jgi:NAD+ diphosphatase
VLDAEQRVLLTRRAADPWRALWCAPSGFCDGPEHPIVAAEREVREEVGIEARVIGYLGTWIDPYANPGQPADEYVSVQYFVAVAVGTGEPNIDLAEVTEARWFPLDDTPDDLAPPETLAAALQALRAAERAGAVGTRLADRPGAEEPPGD